MKECDECLNYSICDADKDYACMLWHPVPCPKCAGRLSRLREHNGRFYRHCYSCNFDFYENGDDKL